MSTTPGMAAAWLTAHARRGVNRLLFVSTAAVVASCNDVAAPLLPASAPTQLEFVDARNGGTAGFYFLPPLAPVVVHGGIFDPDRSPIVSICRLTSTGCAPVVASYSVHGESNSAIRISESDKHYFSQWHTRTSDVRAGETYRVRVLEGQFELGHADIRIVDRASDARALPESVIPLVAGATLPIKFRLEESTLGSPVTESIGASGGDVSVVITGGAQFTFDVPEGALDSTIAFTITPLSPNTGSIGAVSIFPSNLFFKKPVTLTFSFPGSLSDELAASLAVGLGTIVAPRQLILPGSVNGTVLSSQTFILGNPTPPPYLQGQSAAQLALMSITDDEATAMAEAFIADVQARIEFHNTQAAQLLAVRDFVKAVQHRSAVTALAQYIGEWDAASDAYNAGKQAVCAALAVDNGLARGRINGDFGNLWAALRPLISLHAAAQSYGVGESCAALTALNSVVAGIATEFASLYSEAMARPTFPQHASGVLRELFRALYSQGYASAFETEMAVVKQAIQLPLAARYRKAAYAWCRSDQEQKYLAILFRAARDSVMRDPIDSALSATLDAQSDLGFTAAELSADLHACGTETAIVMQNAQGFGTSPVLVGGTDEPGQPHPLDSAIVWWQGRILLAARLDAFICSNEEMGDDRIVVRLNGVTVRELERFGPTSHFLNADGTTLRVDSLAVQAGINPDEGGHFPLQFYRKGNFCGGEYRLADEPSERLLGTVMLNYPRIRVTLAPSSVTLQPGATQAFTPTVDGLPGSDVKWTVTGGTASTPISSDAMTYTAGAAAGSFTVIATSLVDTTRSATAVVQIGDACPAPRVLGGRARKGATNVSSVDQCPVMDISLTPTIASVAVGGTRQFTATLVGVANTQVAWSATGGTISPTGLFTAGSTAGSFTVTATSVAVPGLNAAAQIQVVIPSAWAVPNRNELSIVSNAGVSGYLVNPSVGESTCALSDDFSGLVAGGPFEVPTLSWGDDPNTGINETGSGSARVLARQNTVVARQANGRINSITSNGDAEAAAAFSGGGLNAGATGQVNAQQCLGQTKRRGFLFDVEGTGSLGFVITITCMASPTIRPVQSSTNGATSRSAGGVQAIFGTISGTSEVPRLDCNSDAPGEQSITVTGRLSAGGRFLVGGNAFAQAIADRFVNGSFSSTARFSIRFEVTP